MFGICFGISPINNNNNYDNLCGAVTWPSHADARASHTKLSNGGKPQWTDES